MLTTVGKRAAMAAYRKLVRMSPMRAMLYRNDWNAMLYRLSWSTLLNAEDKRTAGLLCGLLGGL